MLGRPWRWQRGACGLGRYLRPGCCCGLDSTELDRVEWRSPRSDGVLDICDVFLDGPDVLCGILDSVENFTHRRLLQHLADERQSGGDVRLNYVPWYLIGSAFVRCLQLVTCFLEVCGMLVDVFGPIVYLWPSRRHHHENTRFGRVNRDNGLR